MFLLTKFMYSIKWQQNKTWPSGKLKYKPYCILCRLLILFGYKWFFENSPLYVNPWSFFLRFPCSFYSELNISSVHRICRYQFSLSFPCMFYSVKWQREIGFPFADFSQDSCYTTTLSNSPFKEKVLAGKFQSKWVPSIYFSLNIKDCY